MAIDPSLVQLLQALKTANGAALIVACAAAGVLIAPLARPSRLALPAGLVSPAALFLLAALGLAYAFYPNFLDHAEPAMAGLGIALLHGQPLYPPLDDPSFRGLLYGPLVAEMQAAALALGAQSAGLPVLLASKLAGLAAFLAATALLLRLAPGWGFARAYYALFLLPFGLLAFWNRCEPVFLLLVATGLWAAGALGRWPALIVIGACAGLASGMKLHAFLYLGPAAAIVFSRNKSSLGDVTIAAVSAAATFLLLFLPGSASLAGFFGTLQRAAGHGLSGELYLGNLLFLCALWAPLAVARPRALREPQLLALAALQLAVAAIGSKPGAGIHHLLPFIPANALLFASRVEGRPEARSAGASLVWLAALLPGLATSALLALTMARSWGTYDAAGRELARLQAQHPDLVMGVGGRNFYPYAFLRPALGLKGPPQVEYSSYMDLQLAGVPDAPLREALDACRIAHLAIPKREPPFSLTSYYAADTLLFSDALRETFARRYVQTARGKWFDTYACARKG